MNYLYGDSTTSQLTSNFLEFLRDALDFCVFVLQEDARMKRGRAKIRELGEQADAEGERLDVFIKGVLNAVHGGEKGAPDSPTAQCASQLASTIVEAHRQTVDKIRQTLADAIARIEAEEAAGRDACLNALGGLIAPHDPPNTKNVTQIVLGEAGRYTATVEGKADPALSWTLVLGIPEQHPWSSVMRVERLVPHLEIRAPQLAGWITKEVKIRPQRLERYTVTKLVEDDERLRFELRTEAHPELGFDFETTFADGLVKARRAGPADDASVGPFDLQVEDVPQIADLASKLRASIAGLERRSIVTATFDGADFRTLPTFVDFVQQLVGMMTPIVREISAHSLTPNELVLRRPLSNDRREEIFVAKATLREKLDVLPPESRAFFDPLGLDTANRTAASKASSDRPPVRSELPSSVPPPKPMVVVPPPPHTTIKPPQGAPPPAPPVPTSTASGEHASEAPEVEVVEEVEMSSDALLEELPESTRNVVARKTEDGQPQNEALVAALKKIMMLSKNGRAVDAYREYENLFSSAAFANFRPDEQRQALKLMVMAKSHPTARPSRRPTARRSSASRRWSRPATSPRIRNCSASRISAWATRRPPPPPSRPASTASASATRNPSSSQRSCDGSARSDSPRTAERREPYLVCDGRCRAR
jgi:hypothetical protein